MTDRRLDLAGSHGFSNLKLRAVQNLFPAPLEKPLLVLVLFLFSLDALFIGLHGLMVVLRFLGFDVVGSGLINFNIQRDGGIPEIFNYFQLGFASILLIQIYHRSRASIYLVLGLIFAYALFDDAFLIHEKLGVVLAAALALPDMWGLSGGDIAQVLYFAIVAGLLAPLLWGGWVYAPPAHRRFSATLIGLFGALAFFAVFVDFVNALVNEYSRIATHALALVEDGGEMLVATLSCWLALSIQKYVSAAR